MIAVKYLLLLFLAFPCVGQTPKGCTDKYDKFQKLTTVQCRIGRPVPMIAFAYIPDVQPPYFALYFSSLYLYNSATLRFLLDGDVLEIHTDQIDYSIMVLITPRQMSRIVSAKTVEIQIARDEGKLSNDTLRKLRDLEALTRPQ
jgi:hypothetical protein